MSSVRVIRLRLRGDPGGGWSVGVGDLGVREVEAQIDSSALEALERAMERLAVPPAVAIPGRDGARTRTEEAAGRALIAALKTAPALAAQLGYLLGAAGARAALAIDVDAPWLRALPWELLASPHDARPLEPSGAAVIARLTPGVRRAPPAPGALQILRWSPTPGDPICRDISAHLDALCAELSLPPALALDPLAPPEERPGQVYVLHIICHGERDADQFRLTLGDEDRAAGTAAHLLNRILPRVWLALLDVCEGGSALRGELDGLAEQLVAAGAGAAIAPRSVCGVEAARAMSAGTYRALSEAAPLTDAAAAGRTAVRALALSHPSSRWSNHALYVGDLTTLTSPSPLRLRWRPEGWPAPGPDAAELLDRAHQIAGALESGFVGVEHLCMALVDGGGAGPTARQLRYWLKQRDGWRRRLGELAPAAGAEDWGGTPRLRGLAGALEGGFDVEDLLLRLTAPPDQILQRMFGHDLWSSQGSDTLHTRDLSLHARADAPPDALQVLGGPEDGRLLRPSIGDWIGRWQSDAVAEVPLYQSTPLVDRRLSRQHLQWTGPAKVRARRAAPELIRGQNRRLSESLELELRAGDVLALTRATWLVALTTSEP